MVEEIFLVRWCKIFTEKDFFISCAFIANLNFFSNSNNFHAWIEKRNNWSKKSAKIKYKNWLKKSAKIKYKNWSKKSAKMGGSFSEPVPRDPDCGYVAIVLRSYDKVEIPITFHAKTRSFYVCVKRNNVCFHENDLVFKLL